MPEDFNPEAGASSFDEFLARYLAGEQARQARSIDLSRFLTARTQNILQQAGRFALERGQTELDALHILRVIVEDESVKQAIERIGVDPERIVTATEARLPAASEARIDELSERANAATITPSASRDSLRASTPAGSTRKYFFARPPRSEVTSPRRKVTRPLRSRRSSVVYTTPYETSFPVRFSISARTSMP